MVMTKNGDDNNVDELGGSGEVIGSEQTNESTNHELCDSRAPATKSKTSKRSMYNQWFALCFWTLGGFAQQVYLSQQFTESPTTHTHTQYYL